MDTLILGFTQTLGLMLGLLQGGLTIALSTTELAQSVRDNVGPLLLIGIGVTSATFIWKREMNKLLIFVVISIAVLALFYSAESLSGIGKSTGDTLSQTTWE